MLIHDRVFLRGAPARVASWALVFLGLAFAPVAYGVAYPERPLTLVVPFHASGSPDIAGNPRVSKLLRVMQTVATPSLTDSLAQDLAQSLSAALGMPVNVMRQASGKTVAGTRYAARASPDGHTLLFAGSQTITIYPTYFVRLSFDPLRDLTPVANVARMPIAMITAADNPSRTVRDMIAHARRVPGQINYATVGSGTTSLLAGASFRRASGIEIVHINYNGSPAAINAVVAGEVEFGFVPLPAVQSYREHSNVRILAIASAARHPALPEVPTIAESGLEGFDVEGWFGVFAPARTAGAIVSLLNYEINRVLSEESLQRMLSAKGLIAASGTPENFRALVERDRERWAPLVKTVMIR